MKKKTLKIVPKYKVVLTMAGNDYKSEGKAIDEAFAKLALDWEKIKAKGVVKISYGKLRLEHLFYMKQLRRIFINKITRLLWSKRLKLLLEGK